MIDDSNEKVGGERLAQAEPGIKLKTCDAEEQEAIVEAVSRVGSKDLELPAKTEADAQELATIDEQESSADAKLTPSEMYGERRKLPLLLAVPALLILCTWSLPPGVVILSYFYWLFCVYRTNRVVSNLFRTRHNDGSRALTMALLPVYIILAWTIMAIVRPFQISFEFGWFMTHTVRVLSLVLIAMFVYHQWKWPITASMAIRKFEKENGRPHFLPGWLVHTLTGFSFNLVPLYVTSVLAVAANVYYWSGAASHHTFGRYISCPEPAVAISFAVAFMVLQYIGFFALNHRIKNALLTNPEMKSFMSRKRKVLPKVSDDDIVIRYRAFAEWERWFKQRMRERSNKKLVYLLVVLAVFFMIGAPQMALDLLTKIAAGVGGVAGEAGGIARAENINFLNMFQSFLISVMLAVGIVYVSKPSHVGFSKKGIRFLWRHGVLEINGTYVKWDAFRQIRLLMPKGKTSPSDQKLLFDAGNTHGFDRDVTIKLSSVIEMDDRERILKAIEQFAPRIERDASVLQTLQPPSDHSYTELWLQALAAPPKRERFKPLASGAALSDGRFQVQGQLGVGGQGTAYLAIDTHENTSVVLKEFILPVYVDVTVRRQALERFENEARILKHLDHDQIVKLIDFFVEDHRSYLVLEHIEGKSLKQVVEERGPMPDEEVADLTRQMCVILTYLHGLVPPVVHRDFTPDNLILRNDGKLKLVDFNVAQQTDSTATGTVVGKHAYLPPEQFRGTPVPQSDLYALGATLHFLLTGSDPEPISVSHPRRVNPEVSPAMDLFVAKATAMTLEARHQDVADLEAELNSFFLDLMKREEEDAAANESADESASDAPIKEEVSGD